jgi:hypothetical protein
VVQRRQRHTSFRSCQFSYPLSLRGQVSSGNTTGVSFAGATMQSFKNNQIAGNNTDGTPIPAFPGPGGTALQ